MYVPPFSKLMFPSRNVCVPPPLPRWIGAVSGLVYVFLLPSALILKVQYDNKTLSLWSGMLYGAIIAVGFANFLSQFFL